MNVKKMLFITFLLFSFLSFSQNFKKEKRIYMLDITKSMFGLNGTPDIFKQVKDALYEGIENIKNPETLITIMLFQGTNTHNSEDLPSWTFTVNDGTFKNVKETINSYTIKTVPKHNTDIYSALERAKNEIDPERINYIYLLTDGEQSPKGSTIRFDKKDLEESLKNWCRWAKINDTYLFYVMLTEQANNRSIVSIVEEQCRADTVKGTNVDVAYLKPINNKYILNLHDNPNSLQIELSANDWEYIGPDTKIQINLEDNLIFDLNEIQSNISDHAIIVKFKPKSGKSFEELRKENGIEEALKLTLSTDSDIKFISPEINLIVKNKKERTLKLVFIDDEK